MNNMNITIDNINNNNNNNMFLQEEVLDTIKVMQRQETTTYLRIDYLSLSSSSTTNNNNDGSTIVHHTNNKILDGTWRQRIVEWMFGVVDHCSLRRDSVIIAAYYLDLIVGQENSIIQSRQDFQLAAMTSLQLAIKLYDSTVVKLDSMIKLGRGLFIEQDVINMEYKILNSLNWYIHPPTSICFLRQFLYLLPNTVSPVIRYMIAEVTRFISEISICLYKFIIYPSSIITYSGMLIAIERIDLTILPQCQRQQIYNIFSTLLNMKHDSIIIKEVINRLKQSLNNNVSLEDLMQTIDLQCRGIYGFNNKVLRNPTSTTSTIAAYDEPCTNAIVSTCLRSPRDVTNIQQ